MTRFGDSVRKWRHPLVRVAAGLLLGLALQACSGDDAVGPGDGPRLEVWPEISLLLGIGDTVQLEAFLIDATGDALDEDISVAWSSSDSTVAEVDGNGRVRARGVGNAAILARTGANVDSALITVDPLFVLKNYCGGCHRAAGHSSTDFPLTSCPACHLMNSDPDDANHGIIRANHRRASNGYALVDAHEPLLCADCHQLDAVGGAPHWPVSGPNDCIGCHQAAYDSVHAGSGMPTTCLGCHNQVAWDSVSFDHTAASGGFALLGRHQVIACTSCHDPVTGSPLFNPANQSDCFTCHVDDYERQHAGTGIPTTCLLCHTNDGWGVAGFDHAAVSGGFELIGAHGALGCSYCHDPNNNAQPFWNPTDQDDCVSCHQDDYDLVHAGTGMPTTCADCHTVDGPWTDVSFDHAQISQGFALLGVHSGLPCLACHRPDGTAIFNTKDATNCVFCHQAEYDRQHAGSGIPTTCADCHSIDGPWANVNFDHAQLANGFALLGRHEQIPCTSCHDPTTFAPLYSPAGHTDCITCHQADYDFKHAGSGTPTTCLDCHTYDGWGVTNFDHAAVSNGFDLIGAHALLGCTYCHDPNNNDAPRWNPADENDCITCHQDDYDTEHAGSGFSTNCLLCHTIDTWLGAVFDHTQASGGFVLIGAHEQLACIACHQADGTPLFNTKDESNCIFCHQADYDLNHAGTGYPTTCTGCHTVNGPWTDVWFDHAFASGGFDLIGAHASLACTVCHDPNNGAPIYNTKDENQCVVCHQSLYDANHTGTGFPTTCGDCHTPNGPWTDVNFDHANASGGFDLIGAHASLACPACHDPNNGVPIWLTNDENECVVCHQSLYHANHTGTGFPTTCGDCHTPNGPWTDVNFDHATASGGFDLIGAHASLACPACHDPANGVPIWLTNDENRCIVCHQSLYDANHAGTGTPTTCSDCHTVNGPWSDVNFDHATASGGFDLIGRHASLACTACHDPISGASFWNTQDDNDCFVCHENKWAAEHGPRNGVGGGTPFTCEDCHTRNRWSEITFPHDAQWFPIHSGRHRNKWDSCSNCHIDPNDNTVFSCLTCHEHNQSRMDDAHRGEGGYAYESSACLRCHPRGIADD